MLWQGQGDFFAPADLLINTVNCRGAMGAGIALAFKQRFPELYVAYQAACRAGAVQPGRLWVWDGAPQVVNFATKDHWRDPARLEWVETGLQELARLLAERGPVRVHLPALGCGHGGLDWGVVAPLIRRELGHLPARIYVWPPAFSRTAGATGPRRP